MPKEVTIPIGFAVEGLCFLHSMTHSSTGLDGAYEIQYADGRTADILLYGEENIRDWAANPGPFAREKGTRSAVAWTGSCKMFATIAVYHMLWVNPNPTVPVKAVRFYTPRMESVPILMGLTAAVSKAQDQELAVRAAKAKDLFAEAAKAVAAKQESRARELLKQAVAADPTLWDAHRELLDLCEKSGDEDAVLAACQAWTAAGATTPAPTTASARSSKSERTSKAHSTPIPGASRSSGTNRRSSRQRRDSRNSKRSTGNLARRGTGNVARATWHGVAWASCP